MCLRWTRTVRLGPSFLMSRPKRLGGAATGVVPTGGGGAKGFRKVAGGDVAFGCYLLFKRDGRFGGTGVRGAKGQISSGDYKCQRADFCPGHLVIVGLCPERASF